MLTDCENTGLHDLCLVFPSYLLRIVVYYTTFWSKSMKTDEYMSMDLPIVIAPKDIPVMCRTEGNNAKAFNLSALEC